MSRDEVGQVGLKLVVAKWPGEGLIQDEECGFNAIGNGERLVSLACALE